MSEQTELLAALRFAVRGREIGAVHVNDHWTVIIETLKKAIAPAGREWRLVPDTHVVLETDIIPTYLVEAGAKTLKIVRDIGADDKAIVTAVLHDVLITAQKEQG